jgi:hypothetical protein
MKMKNSLNSDELDINELLKTEKRKTTDILCELLNYFSLVPTLAYNAYWYIYFKNILEKATDADLTHCHSINKWINYADVWVILSCIKAMFFLGCVRLCCGNENDTNMLCLLIKSLSSLFASFIFVIYIPGQLHHTYEEETVCFNMEKALDMFYRCEYTYVLFVLLLFCLIPVGGCLVGLKEYIKSRSYKGD